MTRVELRHALLFAAALICATPACQKKSADEGVPGGSLTVLVFEEDRLQAGIAEHSSQAAQSPAVTAMFETMFETLAGAPEVAGAGEALMGQIGAAPQLAEHFAEMLAAIGESSAVQAAMADMAKKNPGAGQEQLTAMFVARVEANTSSEAFDQGIEIPIAELMEAPEIQAALLKLGTRVASSSHLEQTISRVVGERTSDSELIAKLTKLNGGEPPDAARTTDLLLEHVFTQERVEAFYIEVFGLPSVQGYARQLVGDLLSAPSMSEHMIAALATMLADEKFRADGIATFEVLLADPLAQEDVVAAARQLTTNPVTKQALIDLIEAILADPALEPVGEAIVENVADDPAVHDAVVALISDF